MKILKKAKIYRSEKLVQYTKSECRIMQRLDHPFVLKLHASFQTKERFYLVTDYCPCGDLSMILKRQLVLKEHEARFYIAQIILALEYLHSENVIYRDMKPQNILIDGEGFIKLADFGLAKEEVGEFDVANSFCGSPAYLAPETAKKEGSTHSSDIYQVGVVLYELLTGLPPHFN